MGTTYQAQVEVFFPATEDQYQSWQPISRWELQKDYAFARAWFEVSERGWPQDICLIGADTDPKYGYDVDLKAWGDGELFALLEPEEAWPWFVELREHVKRLLAQKYKVRVLTWGE